MSGEGMIRIENVKSTLAERRAVSGGWGALHWFACIPMLLPFIGFLGAMIVVGTRRDAGGAQAQVFLVLIVTWVAWVVAQRITPQLYARAERSAPTGGQAYLWEISSTGLKITGLLTASRIDWRAVKTVREERDRFVFLLTPMSNAILPKRQLSDEQTAALRALIAEVTATGRLGAGVD